MHGRGQTLNKAAVNGETYVIDKESQDEGMEQEMDIGPSQQEIQIMHDQKLNMYDGTSQDNEDAKSQDNDKGLDHQKVHTQDTVPHQFLTQPRNVEQIRNIKKAANREQRIGQDSLYNVIALAATEKHFVRKITVHPDLEIVVGAPAIVEEVRSLLRTNRDDVVFSYDTTFSMGEYYVSPLVTKLVQFVEEPVIPVLFNVHERKMTTSHTEIFKTLAELYGRLNSIPILLDMERAIANAVKGQCHQLITTLSQLLSLYHEDSS